MRSPKGSRPQRAFDIKAYAIGALRRASYRTPMRSEVFKKSRIARNTYRCAGCRETFPRRGVQVDHIVPVVPTTGWDSFDGFIQRLFCPSSGLQVLCKLGCHKEKTRKENAARKAAKERK